MSIEIELGRIADALEDLLGAITSLPASAEGIALEPVPVAEPVAEPVKEKPKRKSRAKAKTAEPEALQPPVETAAALRALGQKIAQAIPEANLAKFSAYVTAKVCKTFMVDKLSAIPDGQVAQAKKLMLAKAKELGYVG
jgi:hypothetical protein